jgi:hypothetical protein
MKQLRCADIRPGDIFLKLNDGKFSNKIITLGQKLAGQLNSQLTHAAIAFDRTITIEAQKVGVTANDLRVQTLKLGYIIYRPTNPLLGQAAATTAKVLLDVQHQHKKLSYSFTGAAGSLTSTKGAPMTRSKMDAFVDKVLEGKAHPFFCSQFVVFVYQFAAEQCGFPAATLFKLSDAKVSPSTLASALLSNSNFQEAGYMIAGER